MQLMHLSKVLLLQICNALFETNLPHYRKSRYIKFYCILIIKDLKTRNNYNYKKIISFYMHNFNFYRFL